MLQGGGLAVYEIGVLDDGTLIGLHRLEMRDSLNCIIQMGKELKAKVEVSRVIEVELGEDDQEKLSEEVKLEGIVDGDGNGNSKGKGNGTTSGTGIGMITTANGAHDARAKDLLQSNGGKTQLGSTSRNQIVGLRSLEIEEAELFLGPGEFGFNLIDGDKLNTPYQETASVPKLIPQTQVSNVEMDDLPSSSLGALSFTSSSTEDSSLSTSSDSTLTGDDSRELDDTIARDSQSEDESSDEDGGFGFGFSLSLTDDESRGKKPDTSNSKRRQRRDRRQSSSSASSTKIPLPAGLMVTSSNDLQVNDSASHDDHVGMGPAYILDSSTSALEVHPPPHLFAKRLQEEELRLRSSSRDNQGSESRSSSVSTPPSLRNVSTSTINSGSGLSSSDGPSTPRDTPSRSSTPTKSIESLPSESGRISSLLNSKPEVASIVPTPFDSAASFLSSFDLDGLFTSRSSSFDEDPNRKVAGRRPKGKPCKRRTQAERRARRLAELRAAERAGAGLMPEMTLEMGRLTRSQEDWEWARGGGTEDLSSQDQIYNSSETQPMDIRLRIGEDHSWQDYDDLSKSMENQPRSWLRELAALKILTAQDLRDLGNAYLGKVDEERDENRDGSELDESLPRLGSSARRSRNSKAKLQRCTCGAANSKDFKPVGEDSILPSSKTIKTRNHSINCSISLEAKRLINRKAKRDRKREEKDKLKENPKKNEEEGEGLTTILGENFNSSSKKSWKKIKAMKNQDGDENGLFKDFANAPSEAIQASYETRLETSQLPSSRLSSASDKEDHVQVLASPSPSTSRKTTFGEPPETRKVALENQHLFKKGMRVILEVVLVKDGKKGGKAFTDFEDFN